MSQASSQASTPSRFFFATSISQNASDSFPLQDIPESTTAKMPGGSFVSSMISSPIPLSFQAAHENRTAIMEDEFQRWRWLRVQSSGSCVKEKSGQNSDAKLAM